MPVPKRKRSKRRRDQRFANKGIKIKAMAACPNCEAAILPHQACKGCGHYKGTKLLGTKIERAMRRVETRKAQQERAAKQQKAAEPTQE